MVLKSRKSKSKRSTLRHKYKVIRKVKEHFKKKVKEEKQRKKAGLKPKRSKDPGLPAQWPFKEELLKDLEWQKQRILAQEKAKKEQRKLKRVAEASPSANEDVSVEDSVEALQETAAKKKDIFAAKKKARLTKPDTAQDPDGSRRAFFKEFVKVVSASDVIIEVLDARDPLGSRCEDVERFVRRSSAGKKIILLLNKIDLVPKEVAEAWLKFLREEMPTVAFKCSTQQQAGNLKQNRSGKGGRARRCGASVSSAPEVSNCLGADTLIQLLKNYARSANIKTAITVGIIGLPNVGKSSLINSLKRARAAQVGNAPGVTRTMQQVNLDKHINLLDSPGIVFSSGQPGDSWAALRNCVKVEQLEDAQAVAAEVVRRCPAKQLMALYKIPAYKDADEFLQHVAFKRGRLLPGGIGDTSTAARIVLHDWHNGKIAYYTMPPQRPHSQQPATLVSSWGQDFDADKVFASERTVIADLPSIDDSKAGFIETESAGPAHVSLDGIGNASSGATSDSSDSSSGNGDSESEDVEDAESFPEPKNTKGSGGSASAAQTPALYGEAGQFNPHSARADKKRRRKEKKVRLGDDFDFAEAFADEVQLADRESEDEDEEPASMSVGDEVPEKPEVLPATT